MEIKIRRTYPFFGLGLGWDYKYREIGAHIIWFEIIVSWR